ncbi:MAG: hypothetical protein GX434_17020 [Peptococcaceae bacterium]|nr:hypothetical protein [Peptococcaceae bacterium]
MEKECYYNEYDERFLFKKKCKDYNTAACNSLCYPYTELYGKRTKFELRTKANIGRELGKVTEEIALWK